MDPRVLACLGGHGKRGGRKSPRLTAGHAPTCWVRRGHVQKHQLCRSAPGFLATEIGAHFEFRPDWYRDAAVRGAVLSYYAQIRSLLRERPELRRYLKRCKHCRIFFFTSPCNVRRDDMGCGFGCREAHRRVRSARRTAAHYRKHPEKKRSQNRKRYLQLPRPDRPAVMEPACETPPPIVRHVRVIVSLVERRQVGWDEIQEMLATNWRQPPMCRRRREVYGGLRIAGRGS